MREEFYERLFEGEGCVHTWKIQGKDVFSLSTNWTCKDCGLKWW